MEIWDEKRYRCTIGGGLLMKKTVIKWRKGGNRDPFKEFEEIPCVKHGT